MAAPTPADPQVLLRGLRVDRSSPVPLYHQVSQHMEREIESGRIANGTVFMNEISLAEQIGLSRPTMRRAMQDLVDKGLVVRRRGVGTRVVQPKVRRPLGLSSLYEDLVSSGQEPTTSVLKHEIVPCEKEVADRLGLPRGADVLRLVRVRSALNKPIAKMTNYLPESLGEFSRAELEEQGLYMLLRARGIQLHSATQSVGARKATAAEARLLGEARNAALLTMQRTAYDDNGAAVEFGTHIYAASRFSFESNLLTP
jgi:GntR family transcriptional regulator